MLVHKSSTLLISLYSSLPFHAREQAVAVANAPPDNGGWYVACGVWAVPGDVLGWRTTPLLAKKF